MDIGEIRPAYFVVPLPWQAENIYAEHERNLARHNGRRAGSGSSTNHKINQTWIDQWRDRWDLLVGGAP